MNNFESKLKSVQTDLIKQGIDGWLLYDYRRSNSLAHTFLNIPQDWKVTRRFFYWIPQKGDPIKIVPLIEPFTLDHLPGVKWTYTGWQNLEQLLFSIASEHRNIAMEYSPYNALPNISKVDGGTIELIQRAGGKIVSSANLLQRYTSVWSDDQLESHLFAAQVLENIVDETWAFIEVSLQKGQFLDEFHVQQYMLNKMEEAGCHTDDWPTCAVNAHSADPHYHLTQAGALPIKKGDFILIDLWCKQKKPRAVYADITRVGVAGQEATEKQREIFNIVKKARDGATAMIRENYERKIPIQGWEVDQLCREVIQEAGFANYFIHRTGHNIGEEVHGPGANLDNFETHDFRELLPGTAFSVEPGIYLPGEFGVRLEYDIYLDFSGHARVTGGIQTELTLLNC